MSITRARCPRRRLRTAAVTLLSASLAPTHARVVPPGERVTLAGEASTPVPEAWYVQAGASLEAFNGARLLASEVQFASFSLDGARIDADRWHGLWATNGALVSLKDASVTAANHVGLALTAELGAGPPPGLGRAVEASVRGSSIAGKVAGASVIGNAVLDVASSTIDGLAETSHGVDLLSGRVTLGAASTVTGQAAGIWIARGEDLGFEDEGRHVVADGATIVGFQGPAIEIKNYRDPRTDASILLRHGTRLHAGNGDAIRVSDDALADIRVEDAYVEGDLRVRDAAHAQLAIGDGGVWGGAIDGAVGVHIERGGRWYVPGDSRIDALDMADGTVEFALGSGPRGRHVSVAGNLSGKGGSVVLHTVLNQGGALANQSTDRLLIEGSVITTGISLLQLQTTGSGGMTDLDGDGQVGPGEGISLVQVGGESRKDAFALAKGYVAIGPYQYTLHAFGPDRIDPTQNLLATGDLGWDYRLAVRRVCEGECAEEGGDQGGGSSGGGDEGSEGGGGDHRPSPPKPRPPSRPAVAPQVASYLSTVPALLAYDDVATDGRTEEGAEGRPSDGMAVAMYARRLDADNAYHSNRSFRRYGYAFDQTLRGWQIGGRVMAFEGDGGNLQAGWVLDRGTVSVTPRAVDGRSHASYTATGMGAELRWRSERGAWMAAAVRATRYRGTVGTALRGSDVAHLKGTGRTMRVEAGMPLPMDTGWVIEPHVRVTHQQLALTRVTDTDRLTVGWPRATRTSLTLGATVAATGDRLVSPYGGLDVTIAHGGDPTVDVSRRRFTTGRLGHGFRVSGGIVARLGARTELRGEGAYTGAMGGFGVSGWSTRVGVKVTF